MKIYTIQRNIAFGNKRPLPKGITRAQLENLGHNLLNIPNDNKSILLREAEIVDIPSRRGSKIKAGLYNIKDNKPLKQGGINLEVALSVLEKRIKTPENAIMRAYKALAKLITHENDITRADGTVVIPATEL